LDGAPPVEELPADVVTIVKDKSEGLGAATWDMAQIATGQYVLKLDAHCSLAEGYDDILLREARPKRLQVLSRYQLKASEWRRGHGPSQYLYMTYPWLCDSSYGCGMHSTKWLGDDGLQGDYFKRERDLRGLSVDEVMTFQGSMWFIERDYFVALGGIEREYILHQEATTIGMKVWLSGGECVVNKDSWYAHLFKGKRFGGFRLNKGNINALNRVAAERWMNDQWDSPMRVRDMRWYVEHFWPIPGWPADWADPHYQAEFVWP